MVMRWIRTWLGKKGRRDQVGEETRFGVSKGKSINKVEKQNLKTLTWHVAGILLKKQHFEKYVKEHEIICLSEAWLEENDNNNILKNLKVIMLGSV